MGPSRPGVALPLVQGASPALTRPRGRHHVLLQDAVLPGQEGKGFLLFLGTAEVCGSFCSVSFWGLVFCFLFFSIFTLDAMCVSRVFILTFRRRPNQAQTAFLEGVCAAQSASLVLINKTWGTPRLYWKNQSKSMLSHRRPLFSRGPPAVASVLPCPT